MFSYERLSKKPLLFKSFTGLTVQEFDDIYYNEIAKRYVKHESKRLSCKRKENRKRKIGAIGRHFKLDVKNRFLMLLVYYRLYIIYPLTGFLDKDKENSNYDHPLVSICRISGHNRIPAQTLITTTFH